MNTFIDMYGDTYLRLFTTVCACVDVYIYIYRKDDLFPTSRDPTTMILGHDPEKRRIGTKSTWPKKRCKEKTMAIHKRDSSPPT